MNMICLEQGPGMCEIVPFQLLWTCEVWTQLTLWTNPSQQFNRHLPVLKSVCQHFWLQGILLCSSCCFFPNCFPCHRQYSLCISTGDFRL